MSRLDDLGDILDGYKGRKHIEIQRDPTADFRERLSIKACEVYDSLNPEIQQKIVKYFNYVEQTGVIRGMEDGKLDEMPLEDHPDFIEECLTDLEEKPDDTDLAEFSKQIDEILILYEGK